MIEIRLQVIPNAFKRQAEESDHHRVCVEDKFRRNLVLYGLGQYIPAMLTFHNSECFSHPIFSLSSSRYCTAAENRPLPSSFLHHCPRKLLEDLKSLFGRFLSPSIMTRICAGVHSIPFPNTFQAWALAVLYSHPAGGCTNQSPRSCRRHCIRMLAVYREMNCSGQLALSCLRTPRLPHHSLVDCMEKTSHFWRDAQYGKGVTAKM